METGPEPFIAALRHSHEKLRSLVEPLDGEQLRNPSYASEWSIAQVLSHLGSQAEIFGLLLDAILSGGEPPGQEAFPAIWAAWDGRPPEEQAAESLRANEEIVERLESFGEEQFDRMHVQLFGMDFDAAGLARMRLSEHALHTWDVAVMLDPTATVESDAASLLVDSIDQLARRTGRPGAQTRRVRVVTRDPERHLVLVVGEAVLLVPASEEGDEEAGGSEAVLELPAEALVRLVYGRLDPDHTPPVVESGVDLGELRQIFPGF